MGTQDKARSLLSEIETQIAETERSLKTLRSQQKEVSRLIRSLGGSASRGPGRPRGRASRTRTDWNKVIGSFKGAFTIDDLAKASRKAKGTVNQAIQNLKKARKIKPTGKRGEYQRAGVASKTAKKKGKASSKPKKKAQPRKPTPASPSTAVPSGTSS